ncbi:MAG: TolC family protein [Pseudomonadota bacterium]
MSAVAGAQTLSLEQVLQTSRIFSPVILAAVEQRSATEQATAEALGAFDLKITGDGYSRASGFYDGVVVGGKVEQPLRAFGANVYGQYRLSSGDFPIYEDQSFTNLGGQAKAGVMLSLLRDRLIDERRFAETDAVLAIDAAQFDVLLAQINVQQMAAMSYWRWVAAGLQLEVYRDLLDIAEQRTEGLEREVSSGARASIFLTENQQTITQRRELLTAAERDFKLAANRLSIFWRNSAGLPTMPPAERVPDTLNREGVQPKRTLARLAAMKAARPDLGKLQNRISRAAVRLKLDENRLKPRLDLRFEVSEGLGGVGEGGVSRDSTDTVVGFYFSVPFQRRAARARLAASRSKLKALEYELQRLDENIDRELQALVLSLRYAERLATLAGVDVQQSDDLWEAEKVRFRNGASDFFLVNVRETALANARIRQIRAMLDQRLAETNFDAATMNLGALSLSEP